MYYWCVKIVCMLPFTVLVFSVVLLLLLVVCRVSCVCLRHCCFFSVCTPLIGKHGFRWGGVCVVDLNCVCVRVAEIGTSVFRNAEIPKVGGSDY